MCVRKVYVIIVPLALSYWRKGALIFAQNAHIRLMQSSIAHFLCKRKGWIVQNCFVINYNATVRISIATEQQIISPFHFIYCISLAYTCMINFGALNKRYTIHGKTLRGKTFAVVSKCINLLITFIVPLA